MAKRLRKGAHSPKETSSSVTLRDLKMAEESFKKIIQRINLKEKIPPDIPTESSEAQSTENNPTEIQKKPPLGQKALRKLLSQKKIDVVADDIALHPDNLSFVCGLLQEKPSIALNAAKAIYEAGNSGADLSGIVRRLFEADCAWAVSQSISDDSRGAIISLIKGALERYARVSPVIPEISEFLSCDDPAMKYTALCVLAELFGHHSPTYFFLLPKIEERLEDPHPKVRWVSGNCLCHHHLNEEDLENLTRLLTHKDSGVRSGAFSALLGRFFDVQYDPLMQTLLFSLGDETKDVRSDALEILSSFPSIKGEGATKKIIEELFKFMNSKKFLEQAEQNSPFFVRAVKSMATLSDRLQSGDPSEI